jgi:hypothetical protein
VPGPTPARESHGCVRIRALIDLVGAIGRTALSDLLLAHRRQRVKARTRENPTSTYGPNAGQHPQKVQNYTVHTTVAFFTHGLNSRSRR